MPNPLLSVLVPTLQRRNWQPLVDHLNRQAAKYPDKVEVLTELDDGQATSGVKRQALVNRSRGEYLCFVDDDDWVANYYIEGLLSGIERAPDVVTFKSHLTWVNNPARQEVWSYRLVEGDQRHLGVMSAGHLCAWRRGLATSVGWCPYLGYGDDQLWYKPLIASFASITCIKEVHIEEILYHYHYSATGTANQTRERMQRSYSYAANGVDCYLDGYGSIVVGRGNLDAFFDRGRIIPAQFGLMQSLSSALVPVDGEVIGITSKGEEAAYGNLRQFAKVRIR